ASSGVHSNGFSLVRKLFDADKETALKMYSDSLGKTLGEELLTPTKIYVKPVLELMSKIDVNAISHITGGGFYENIPRMLKDGTNAVIERSKIDIPPVFELIQSKGVCERDMFNTFNMGVGLCIAVPAEQADEACRILNECGEKANIIGEIKAGRREVDIC
ncbi:MAG: phosphoribosylformylglycinamidine cyclo-ligase, partial [Oscillospiraceae bacterium]|nr:phosphoribosylformylglycinamidine cyclo-ligase [Oscillospiraceae bacterium]